ncbi:membrane protein of ER body 1-like [Prosopis cineraria]|uniref:membrane protein of ER body 1-like n=1 Tax=Prosopis cineraria TaxID=364024 RepID=UPI00240F7DBE|nr:membrane protein of ER body 1-like [Prosopis cineraria]
MTIESEKVDIITENERSVKELYLESLYQKPPTQGFYCPNCKACVQKVLILEETIQEIPESNKKWEILKSIVFGGLMESVISLVIVISATIADYSCTAHILTLSLANLMGGHVILIFYKMVGLKSEQPRGNNQTGECLD